MNCRLSLIVCGVLCLSTVSFAAETSPGGDSGKTASAPAETVSATPSPKAESTGDAVKPEVKPEEACAWRVIPSPVELGRLPFGAKKTFGVTLINQATTDLSVKNVRPSCSCLTVDSFTKEAAKPGAQCSVTCTITADEKEGATRKKLYIHTSDKDNPIVEVDVNVIFHKAEGPTLVISNDVLDFGKVAKDAGKQLAVARLMNFGDQALAVTDIQNSIKGVTLALDSKDLVEPHKGVTLRAWLDASQIEGTELSGEAYILTNAPLTPAVTLTIKAAITPATGKPAAKNAAESKAAPDTGKEAVKDAAITGGKTASGSAASGPVETK